jgi:hypothetical protein
MPSTILRPEHVGEPLVSALLTHIEGSNSSQQLTCYPCVGGQPISLDGFFKNRGLSRPITFDHNIRINPPMFNGLAHSLDGAQKLDCFVTDGTNGLAIEVKLGAERMAKATFESRFLTDCDRSGHKDARLKGNIIAVLDGRYASLSTSSVPLAAVGKIAMVPLATEWLLVLRRVVWRGWTTNGKPSLKHATIVVFEDLVPLVGGPSEFNQIVLNLLGKEFAQAWDL